MKYHRFNVFDSLKLPCKAYQHRHYSRHMPQHVWPLLVIIVQINVFFVIPSKYMEYMTISLVYNTRDIRGNEEWRPF